MEYVGKNFYTVIKTALDDSGLWRVEYNIVQEVTKDGVDWDKREVTINTVDKDLDTAMAQATFSIITYMKTINYDLFAAPEVDKSKLN